MPKATATPEDKATAPAGSGALALYDVHLPNGASFRVQMSAEYKERWYPNATPAT